MTGFAPFDRLIEPLAWHWVGWVVFALLIYKGSRLVGTGFRAVYRFCGIALFEVPAGLWPGLWPFLDVTNELFCADQIEESSSKDPQKVVTKDGVTCELRLRLLWGVNRLKHMVTRAYDADDQLRAKAESEFGGNGGWISRHTYEECYVTRPTLEMIPETVKLADYWGIKLAELEILSFAPANPEAQTLATCLVMEKQRGLAARERVKTAKAIVAGYPELTLNPSLVFAALSGMPISVVAPADQLAALRAGIKEISDKLPPDEKETEENLAVTAIEAGIGQIPVIGPMVQSMVRPLAQSLKEED